MLDRFKARLRAQYGAEMFQVKDGVKVMMVVNMVKHLVLSWIGITAGMMPST